MYPLLWMVGLMLIGSGFRTAAESLKDTSPKKGELKCYSCGEYDDETGLVPCGNNGVIVVTCPVERPVCWSVANATAHNYLIGCGPDTEKAKSFGFKINPILKSDLSLIYQCTEPKCNRPIDSSFFLEALKFVRFNNNYNVTIAQLFENFTRLKNVSMDHVLVDTTKIHFGEIKRRPKPTQMPSSTSKPINGTIANPHAEPLKQDTEASEDDEDEGEGSGSLEDFKNKRLASSPPEPNSFLPAKENKANYSGVQNFIVLAISIIVLVSLDNSLL